MDISNLHKTLQQLRVLTKYGMTGICVLMTTHCGLLFLGYDLFVVHLLFVSFVMSIGLWLSHIFDLCWVHKASVIYSMSVIACVVMRRHNVFDEIGICVQCARFAMFVTGVIMVGLNVWKAKSKKNC